MARQVSRRAQKAWDRLASWYGSRLLEQYGKHPPEDWCSVIDRVDDERLEAGLLAVRRETPAHPPTLGQLENAIPRKEATGPGVPSRAERAADLMLASHGKELCKHQLRFTWNYFGPVQDFPNKSSLPEIVSHPYVRGVQVAECAECGLPSRRVVLAEDLVAVA